MKKSLAVCFVLILMMAPAAISQILSPEQTWGEPAFDGNQRSAKYDSFDYRLLAGEHLLVHPAYDRDNEAASLKVDQGWDWLKVRVQLRYAAADKDTAFTVRFYGLESDGSLTLIDSINSDKLFSDGLEEISIFGPRYNHLSVRVESDKLSAGSILNFVFFEYDEHSDVTQAIGRWNAIPIDALLGRDDVDTGALLELSNNIVRIATERSSNRPIRAFGSEGVHKFCTGFLVQNDDPELQGKILITNNHCIQNTSDCHSSTFSLGYTRLSGRVRFKYSTTCARMIYFNKYLDLSILELTDGVKVHGSAGLSVDPRRIFKESDTDGVQLPDYASEPYAAMMIHHPAGWTQQVSWGPECQIPYGELEHGVIGGGSREYRKVRDRDLVHSCDTIKGSSGSPILDWENHTVLGVHYADRYYGGSIEMKNLRHTRNFNRAISIQAIRRCLNISDKLHVNEDHSVIVKNAPHCGNT